MRHDFCVFEPDHPSCIDRSIFAGDESAKETMLEWDEEGLPSYAELKQTEVVYFTTALSLFAHAALTQWHYRSAASYYDAGDALSVNWWKFLNSWWNNYIIGWMGLCTITQLLKLVGIALDGWNTYLWWIGGFLYMFINFALSIVALVAYDFYWQVSTDDTSSKQADAVTTLAALQQDIVMHMVFETAAGLILWTNYETWVYTHYLFLSEEVQNKYMKEVDGDHKKLFEQALGSDYTLFAAFFTF